LKTIAYAANDLNPMNMEIIHPEGARDNRLSPFPSGGALYELYQVARGTLPDGGQGISNRDRHHVLDRQTNTVTKQTAHEAKRFSSGCGRKTAAAVYIGTNSGREFWVGLLQKSPKANEVVGRNANDHDIETSLFQRRPLLVWS